MRSAEREGKLVETVAEELRRGAERRRGRAEGPCGGMARTVCNPVEVRLLLGLPKVLWHGAQSAARRP